MSPLRPLLPALFALAIVAAPSAASAQSFSDGQRGEIETIIKNYLVSHPEVLEEAMAELNKRQAAAEDRKARSKRRAEFEHDLQLAPQRDARQQER